MKSIYLKLNNLAELISDEIIKETKKIGSIKVASIILGNDPASLSYLNGMKKKAAKLGFDFEIIQYDKKIKEDNFLNEIMRINKNKKYSGIIVQVPIPKQINFHKLALTIDYKKDIDGINPLNQGLLFAGKPFMIPATAFAVSVTLDYVAKNYDIKLAGMNAAIIGRSLTVGRPVIHLLLNKNITPTIIHTKTIDTDKITSNKDIVIASCGVPELINAKWIKKNAVVIDVGIHSINADNEKGYKLCGDVDAESVLKKASILTAVPGGIGTVTSTLVFANTIKSWYKINKDKKLTFSFE